MKTAILEGGGAESGALAETDSRFALLMQFWLTLPEPLKAGILAMVQAAGQENELRASTLSTSTKPPESGERVPV